MISGDQEDGLKIVENNFDYCDNKGFDSLIRSNERLQTHMVSRPNIIPGKIIREYSEDELDSIIRWIKEDGKLRTDEELLEEIMKELGFRKKGKLIRSALSLAISRSK
jgi:predicted double-glycine peptidase